VRRLACIVSIVALVAAACGGKQTPAGPGSGDPDPIARDNRTPIEKRRDAACDALGPKLTACAVEDARQALAAGKITKKQFDEDTTPQLQKALTQDWLKKCKASRNISSRQVRVLEVCFQEEQQCGPLHDCLLNLDPVKTPGK
jgi:hypothetical protein